MSALVTGGRGGIGAAIGALLDGDVIVLDLPDSTPVPGSVGALEGEFDAAFLNAGIGIGFPDVAELPDSRDRPHRAREPPRRRLRRARVRAAADAERRIDRCTASLAGLTGMPFDPCTRRRSTR